MHKFKVGDFVSFKAKRYSNFCFRVKRLHTADFGRINCYELEGILSLSRSAKATVFKEIFLKEAERID